MSEADAEVHVVDDLTPEQSVAVSEFCAFTGATADSAKQALEACGWNLEMAVTMQIDSGEPVNSASVASGSSQPSTSAIRPDEDNVRAPIPPVRQVLVDDFADMEVPLFGPRTRSQIPMFNNTFRDFQREARFREELAAGGSSSSPSDAESGVESAKRRTLEDLFRPPIDIMFQGSFESAKDRGVRDNRWLMINIQDESEFACQVLNRDIWSNAAVRSIIEEHFVFWQVYKNGREGLRYMQFYPVNQFPYVAILDPRTGEKLKVWNVITDSNMFCELVTDFLQEHPTPTGEPIPETPVLKPVPVEAATKHKIGEMSEEEQLKAAIAASLQEPIRICDDEEDIETFSCDGDDDSPVEVLNDVLVVSDVEKGATASAAKSSEDSNTKQGDDDYTKYLGREERMADLVLRLPDGGRETLTVPCDTKLKAIFLLVQSKGFSLSQYDIVTNFPRRCIHDLPPDSSLIGLNLLKEQLYIQLKQ